LLKVDSYPLGAAKTKAVWALNIQGVFMNKQSTWTAALLFASLVLLGCDTPTDADAEIPAVLVIENDADNGAGEYIEWIKILSTSEDREKQRLGIGQFNDNYRNDGDADLYREIESAISRGASKTLEIAAGKYFVKITVYRGSFLGWLHCQSKSFSISKGQTLNLVYDYKDGEGMGLSLVE
jgi:hypothetical protein